MFAKSKNHAVWSNRESFCPQMFLSSINGNNEVLRCRLFNKVFIQMDRWKMKLKLISNYSDAWLLRKFLILMIIPVKPITDHDVDEDHGLGSTHVNCYDLDSTHGNCNNCRK